MNLSNTQLKHLSTDLNLVLPRACAKWKVLGTVYFVWSARIMVTLQLWMERHCQLVHNGRRIEFACEVVCRLQTCLLYASPMWHIGPGPIMYIGPGPIFRMGPDLFNT